MAQEEKKDLLETALAALAPSEETVLEEAEENTEEVVVETAEESVEETAVFKVWGEDEDTQEAEHEDEDEAESDEDEVEVDSEVETDSEEEEETEEAAHEEDEDEAEEAYGSYDEDEHEVEEDEHEAYHDEDEDDDVEEAEHEVEEADLDDGDGGEVEEIEDDEVMEDEEDDGIDGTAAPTTGADDVITSSIDKIAGTITAAAADAAMKKINAAAHEMKEDIDALVAGDESLSEEFKTKAATIFEAAVSAKAREQAEKLEESYADSVKEQVEGLYESLVDQIDSYMTYVAEQWVKENEVAVTNVLRTEIAEGFMASLKESFEDHYIEMPEGKTDMFDEMSQRAGELEEQVAEAEATTRKLRKQLVESHRKAIVKEASEGLADTQAAKLSKLLEDVRFESTSKFKEKVATIKESYFSQKIVEEVKSESKVSNSNTHVEVVVEDIEEEASIDPIMEKYIKATSKLERDLS
jgi:hypothetical protein